MLDPAVERLIKRRKQLKWSLLKLAEESGVTVRTIGNVEKGENVTLKTLAKLCDSLDLKVVVMDKKSELS